MANDVSTAVSNALASYAGSSLIVTGHSLGGGLAALAASSLAGQGHQLTAYTYGEPRNGNPAFTSYINSQVPNYYRVTHYNDGVPQIPLRYWASNIMKLNTSKASRMAIRLHRL